MVTTPNDVNPYQSHPALSPTEAAVLSEYATLALHVSHLAAASKALADNDLLVRLRALERRMSLVLTLFKASVWGVINEQT